MDHNQLRFHTSAAVTSDQPGQKLMRHETLKPAPTKNNRRSRGAGAGGCLPPQKSDYCNGDGHKSGGSGMRAIFLVGGSGNAASTVSGTGVFLPRVNDNNSTGSRRRPRCSSVLIPSRVTQALMLHFKKTTGGGSSSSFWPQHVADIADGRNTGMCIYYPNKMITHKSPLTGPNLDNYNGNNSGLQLPEEWIY